MLTAAAFVETMRRLIKPFDTCSPQELVVLPDIIDQERVLMVPMTCRAFLEVPNYMTDKYITLVMDGKMRALASGWVIVTVGWLASSQENSKTNLACWARRQPLCQTAGLRIYGTHDALHAVHRPFRV